MKPRLLPSEFYKSCPRAAKHLVALGDTPVSVDLSLSLIHLVRLRASQLNHCGYCQWMHAKEARAAQEQQARLDVLAAWREVGGFSPHERAALAWTEALTLLSQKDIPDALYQDCLQVLGQTALVELTMVILQINSWNRIAVAFRFQPEVN
ncbi:carboxymuconolactone decarboxylase family protein [Pseudidiomarina sediminum]|uniref:carboxymuconolactone decarboxylase family protein n=1 Tax=Pseudidiomarina sediminum TaxID=431675 RepID=UPI001C969E79|nr:carboxymuconolactone decarboxylase family protein [Pseudidiomarina sediminum]MBY6063324.1 carboxymuconolactone decarboxylase family protein [Pseudidiomarina sediminum]